MEGKPPYDPARDADYRAKHSSDGYPLGSSKYPDNREGRRKLQQSWRGKGK